MHLCFFWICVFMCLTLKCQCHVSSIIHIFRYRSVSNNTWYRTSTRMASVFPLRAGGLYAFLITNSFLVISYHCFCCNIFPVIFFVFLYTCILIWMFEAFFLRTKLLSFWQEVGCVVFCFICLATTNFIPF